MSYILEALRRSESERRHAGEPAMPAAPTGPSAPTRSRLGLYLGAGFLLGGIALVALYFAWVPFPANESQRSAEKVSNESGLVETPRPVAPLEPVPAPAPLAAAPTPAPVLKPVPFLPEATAREVRDLAEQARTPAPVPVAATARRAAKPLASTVEPEGEVKAEVASVAATPSPYAGVKFLRAMPPEFRQSVPELVVNIHIYSPDPAASILYINNRQYQPGDRLREDLRVEAIVEDGAVLSFRGERFKLPRPT